MRPRAPPLYHSDTKPHQSSFQELIFISETYQQQEDIGQCIDIATDFQRTNQSDAQV
jgi:hypothetical protein